MMTRRQALKTTALATFAGAALPNAFGQPAPTSVRIVANAQPGPFRLPPLPYSFDALEPYIDARTMEIHHDRHHAGYVANLNKAVYEPRIGRGDGSIEALLRDLDSVPAEVRTAVRNNGGGHYNHSLFWQMMKPGGGGAPKGDLAKAIDSKFGSFAAFKDQFTKAALSQFGSGWAWLTLAGSDLQIEATPNQDTPLFHGAAPLLGLDVWEHAYYLKYQNKRAEYIGAWWNVVNWDFVAERFEKQEA